MHELPIGEVSEIFDEWAKEMNIPTRDIMFSMDRNESNKIHIYTDRPGLMIGKAGCLIDKYKSKLNQRVDSWNVIKVRLNKEKGRTEKLMPYVQLDIVEVTRADFWLHYDPMSEGF